MRGEESPAVFCIRRGANEAYEAALQAEAGADELQNGCNFMPPKLIHHKVAFEAQRAGFWDVLNQEPALRAMLSPLL